MIVSEALAVIESMSLSDMGLVLHASEHPGQILGRGMPDDVLRRMADIVGLSLDDDTIRRVRAKELVAICCHVDGASEDDESMFSGHLDVQSMTPADLVEIIFGRISESFTTMLRKSLKVNDSAVFDPDTPSGALAWDVMTSNVLDAFDERREQAFSSLLD